MWSRDSARVTTAPAVSHDDYNNYHGEYGIGDIRIALFEAHQRCNHPFCVAFDEPAHVDLLLSYGTTSQVFIADIGKLPYRTSEIYLAPTSQ